ncbi:MAG: tetratricopeptide repeat protein [Pseudomonadota bacterium]
MSRTIVLAAAAGFALTGCATAKAGDSVVASAPRTEPLKALENDPTSVKTREAQAKTLPAKTAKKDSRKDGKPKVDKAARAAIEREDSLAQMAFWAAEYATFPEDVEAAQKFSDVLRKGGRPERAVEVAQTALERNPGNRELTRVFALALLSSGRSGEALRPLSSLAQTDQHDWRARSALGVALDEQSRFEEARQAYKDALAIKADDPGVLTNLGVSYLLGGDAKAAEILLRQAAALPLAPPETRQNLALAVGLQGRLDEAEQLQKVDLPPALVANNMSYLRGLITDDRRWGDTRKTSQQ